MKLKSIVFILLFALIGHVTVWASVSREQVTQIYVATFNRAPDAAGLNFWVNSGRTINQIAAEFFKVPETQRKYPEGTTEEAFINTIYQNVFGRDAEQAGLDYWANVLGNGWETRDNMILTVINGAAGKDQQVLVNKAEVGLYYVDEVGTNHVDGYQFSLADITDDVATATNAKQAINLIAGNPGGSLKDDIEYYMALFSSAEELSPMVDEVTALLGVVLRGDPSVVTITPPLETININNPPPNINITADFGNGYTPPESTAVYTGSAVIDITGIAFTQTGIAANLSLTATNVQRNGEPVFNGAMTGSLNFGMAGENISMVANLNFSNLASMGELINGGIGINIPALSGEGRLLQPAVYTLNQFSAMGYQLNGTMTMTEPSAGMYDVDFNITTNQGPVTGRLLAQMDMQNLDLVTLSTPQGPMTVGTAIVTVNQVIIDSSEDSTCTDLPVSGNIVVTEGGETATITFSNCAYTVN